MKRLICGNYSVIRARDRVREITGDKKMLSNSEVVKTVKKQLKKGARLPILSDDDNAKEATKKISVILQLMFLKKKIGASMAISVLQKYPSAEVPALAVDGIRLYFNPDYVLGKTCFRMTDRRLIMRIEHEAQHIWKLDPLRFKCEDPRLWYVRWYQKLSNIASDHGINLSLLGSGYTRDDLGDGIADDRFLGMNDQQIFQIIRQENPPVEPTEGECGEGEGSGSCGHEGCVFAPLNEDGSEMNQSQTSSVKAKLIRQNYNALKKATAGGDPSCEKMAQTIDQNSTVNLNWKEYHRLFLQRSFDTTDQSFRRLDRRFIDDDIYLPDMYSEGINHLIYCFDESGSVSNSERGEFSGQVNHQLVDFNPSRVSVLRFSTVVHEAVEYERGDYPLDLDRKFSGGTNFQAVFEYIDKNYDPSTIDGIIFLTDMYNSRWPKHAPVAPVLFVSTGKTSCPFGKCVKLDAGGLR